MGSDEQNAANRANAKKSTGPRTQAGKRASSKNAVTHGLFARPTSISKEEAALEARFRSELIKELQPVGLIERQLAGRIAGLFWRLERGERIEAAILQREELATRLEEKEDVVKTLDAQSAVNHGARKIARDLGIEFKSVLEEEYIMHLIENTADEWMNARGSVIEARRELDGRGGRLAEAFLRAEQPLLNLSRYERTHQRQLLETLAELEKRQSKRASSQETPR